MVSREMPWQMVSVSSSNDVLLHSEQIMTPGYYQEYLSLSQCQAGTYYFVMDLDGETVAQIVVKL